VNNSCERVLCFPRSVLDDIGDFQGFMFDDGKILKRILMNANSRFVERRLAEEDPSLKQLIPYVVMKYGNKILHYVRGKETGEQRLKSLGSIGIGGHISLTDHGLFANSMLEVFNEGLRREVAEEVEVNTNVKERIVGLINDDSNPVGQVHLGVLLLWELTKPEVRKRERVITSLEFLTFDELETRKQQLESWSQIALAALLEIYKS